MEVDKLIIAAEEKQRQQQIQRAKKKNSDEESPERSKFPGERGGRNEGRNVERENGR